ncbi:hypothetical protein OSB04_029392 [Centaurea solstitialis]|uniref:Uncharacterized protein n=1 Tax=Centaurea solstitialis TaxID=347529 RepID=A0AA38WC34_9ASTR|nr:hypothetical protein OSB04_029392 [Centaurea solstitialis]
MARDSCLARITAGVAVGGAVGGAVGPWTHEDQIYWTSNGGQCCYFWSFPWCWELDTLWEVVLSSIDITNNKTVVNFDNFLARFSY